MRKSLIVFDLEATCWAKEDPLWERQLEDSETIELGAVFLQAGPEGFRISGEFDGVVRPTRNPILTQYCLELTHITQEMVDSAPTFPEVWGRFLGWASSLGEEVRFASWGGADPLWIARDCESLGLENPWDSTYTHVNLKEVFVRQMARLGTTYKKVGLQKALARAGLEFIGTPHRGIDDARMTALLGAWLYDPLSFTPALRSLYQEHLALGRALSREEALKTLRGREDLLLSAEEEAHDLGAEFLMHRV